MAAYCVPEPQTALALMQHPTLQFQLRLLYSMSRIHQVVQIIWSCHRAHLPCEPEIPKGSTDLHYQFWF